MVDYLKIAREARERWTRSNSGGEEIPTRTGECPPISTDTSGSPSDDVLRVQSHESHEGDVAPSEGAEDIPATLPPVEDAALTHIVGGLDSLLKEEPEYARERDPEVLINAVASRSDMFFVPTLAEMIEAMKIKGLKPSTIADAEVAMRRLLRAPRNEKGWLNGVQAWVEFRGRMTTYRDPHVYLSTIQAARDLQFKGYLVDTPAEEVAEVLDKLVKEQKRANLRNKKHQRTKAARKSAMDDSSAGSHQEDESGGG